MEVLEFRIARVVARAIGADRRDFAAVLCPSVLDLDDPYYEPRVDVDVVHVRCARGVAQALCTRLHTRPRGAVAEFGESCFAIALDILEAALNATRNDGSVEPALQTATARDEASRTCQGAASESSAR